MKIDVTEGELALCVAALEFSAKELKDGLAASEKLNLPLPDAVTEMAAQMDALRARFLADGQSTAEEPKP